MTSNGAKTKATKVKIRRKPLWRAEVSVELKDGTRLGSAVEVRMNPGDVRDGVEDDPIDEAMDQLFADAQMKAVEDHPEQLVEFNINLRRV